jgi:hypothetical protein
MNWMVPMRHSGPACLRRERQSVRDTPPHQLQSNIRFPANTHFVGSNLLVHESCKFGPSPQNSQRLHGLAVPMLMHLGAPPQTVRSQKPKKTDAPYWTKPPSQNILGKMIFCKSGSARSFDWETTDRFSKLVAAPESLGLRIYISRSIPVK